MTGTYPLRLDLKGRCVIPGAFAELGTDLVVTRALSRCLYVFSAADWADLEQRWEHSPLWRAMYGTGAHPVSLQDARRIQIPCALREYAGFRRNGEVAVVGCGRAVILCEWERWEQLTRDLGACCAACGRWQEGVQPVKALADLWPAEALVAEAEAIVRGGGRNAEVPNG